MTGDNNIFTESLVRISLIIVTWNGDDVLKACLESFLRIYGRLPETIVVDNANQDSTRQLAIHYDEVRYVPLTENRGFAGGNNAALEHCTHEYLLLLNNDTELDGDAITPLVDFLDSHADCGAVQGIVKLARARHLLNGCGGFFDPLGILAFEGCYEKDIGQYNFPRQVFTIGGCFFMTRKSAIMSCGGLFYDHFKSYYEEVDFCHRLNLSGWTCWCIPTPTVFHWESLTAKKFARQDILTQYYRNIWFSFLTCFGRWARCRFCTTLFLLCLGQSTAALLRMNAAPLLAHFNVLKRLKSERSLIAKTRSQVQALRKVPDEKLLRLAVRHQSWSHYKKFISR